MVKSALKDQDLPEWDLSDLYHGMEDSQIESDLQTSETDAEAFAAHYKGKVATLSGSEFGRAIAQYESLDETLSRLGSYAQLLQSGNVTDPQIGRFYQTITERITAISTHVLFFSLEINRLEDRQLEALLTDLTVSKYQSWLRDLRAVRPHQLSDDLEKILHEKTVAGATAWIRLFDETLAGLTVDVKGRGGGKAIT
ncbi:MAG: oligoendopeptidase F, partial [Alphaproteobacteria bacterium]